MSNIKVPKEIRALQKNRRKIKADYNKLEERWAKETKHHRDALDFHEMEITRIAKLRGQAATKHYKELDDNHREIITANKGRLTIAQLMEVLSHETSNTACA